MLKAIQNNPFRVLGVYANSPKRDIVSNKGRMSAFLNVGREVTFPLDLQGILPTIQRDADIVANADSELSLPAGQLKHGQFWFVKTTPIDDIAFNHLQNGNIDNAIEMWGKRQCMSSLQNRVVVYLIKEEYRQAISCAQELYDSYSDELVTTIAGDTYTCTSDDLIHHFIDKLLEEKAVDPMLLFEIISHLDWVTYLKGKLVEPLIQQIESAIGETKSIERQNAPANYQAGLRLINFVKKQLDQLKDLIPRTDLQYQIIADKLGLQILQCGINYYNNSDDDDAAHKAMKLQRYAMSVVVGDIAKDRCNENVRILEGIITKLPPKEVMSEYKAVMKELEVFCKRPDLISHADTLLKNTQPFLQKMKTKLGVDNAHYLNLSTQVVGNALHNVIEEVNNVQKTVEIDDIHAAKSRISYIKSVLEDAWEATKLMDTFDLESDFKINRYNPNRSTLKKLCEQLGVNTSPYYNPVSTPTPTPVSPKEYAKEKKESNDRSIIIFVIVFILILIGIFCLSGGVSILSKFCYIIAIIGGLIAYGLGHVGELRTFFIFAAIAAVFGFSGYGLSNIAKDIEYKKEKELIEQQSASLFEEIKINPTIELCSKYIRNYRYSENANDVFSIWSNLLLDDAKSFDYGSIANTSNSNDNPLKILVEFVNKNRYNMSSRNAEQYIVHICDSLYNLANKSATIAAWKTFQKTVPSDYWKDSEEKIKEIENKSWSTESKAWDTATKENSISAYQKYKTLYPNGKHYDLAEKKLIDLEVENVYAGDYGTLPAMDKTGYGGGPTSYITVKNRTSYTLTLLYSGIDSKRLVISAGQTSSLRLKNGSYKVAASVSAYNVRNYAGKEYLNGGSYDVEYYISSQRF